jgi:phosphatidylserine decarboxylase
LLHTRYKGPHDIACNASFVKGDEMGWFEHGSTILVFVPKSFEFVPELCTGQGIQMGQPLFKLP